MKYKILAIIIGISLCLGLTACGGGEKTEETTSSTERAASVSNRNLKDESVVIAVGKTTVPYKEYLAYYYFMRSPYGDILNDKVWNYSKAGIGGRTIGQEAVEAVLRLIIQVKVICKEAAIQKVVLGTDEKEQAAHSAKTFCDSLSDEIKQKNKLDVTMLTRIFEENKLAQKMYNIEIGKVDANLTAEQLKAARVQLIYWSANDKNREEIKKKAEQVRQSIAGSKGNFYTMAKKYTEADEIEIILGGSDLRTNLARTVCGMAKDTLSNVITERDGSYLAYCIAPDSKEIEDQYRNQVIQDKQTKAFQTAYEKWSKDFEVKVSKALLVEKK